MKGSQRSYWITCIIREVATLAQSSEGSKLGWFEDGIGLNWYWNVDELSKLTDNSLQDLYNHRNDKYGIDFDKVLIECI